MLETDPAMRLPLVARPEVDSPTGRALRRARRNIVIYGCPVAKCEWFVEVQGEPDPRAMLDQLAAHCNEVHTASQLLAVIGTQRAELDSLRAALDDVHGRKKATGKHHADD